jgi:outer membrane lipoprotein-sorting protein
MGVGRFFKPRSLAAILAVGIAGAIAWPAIPAGAGEAKPKPPAVPCQDEPAAHALYTQMIQAMRQAKSLSYTSRYRMEAKGRTILECIYRVWLKKPNYFRVETERTSLVAILIMGKTGGTLIGDGKTLWIYWPGGRLQFGPDDKDDQATRLKQYMTKPAPLARHSIGHEVAYLGAGSMPILDPSTFHGYSDSLQPYVDGVRGRGVEKVGSEECDQIEVSIMKGQRIWILWLSKRDHLPRKLKQIVHVRDDIIMLEDWSAVTLDAEIPDTMFVWKPPEGWKQWREPTPEERLLKPGVKAPDFDLASVAEGRVKLSDYRGRIVWLYIWRAG